MALVIKNPPANAGYIRGAGSIPGLERSPGGGHSNPLQYFSSIVAWRIPWKEEPGGRQSMGSQRVGHNWSYLVRTHSLQLEGLFAPFSFRPVPGIVQAVDSVLLKMETLMSWLQSGHHAVSFLPLVVAVVSAKQLRDVPQTLLSMSFS